MKKSIRQTKIILLKNIYFLKMAEPEMAGIGALLKPNKYNILKFVDLHPGGAAKLSGEIHEDDRLVAVNGTLVKDMTAEAVRSAPRSICSVF